MIILSLNNLVLGTTYMYEQLAMYMYIVCPKSQIMLAPILTNRDLLVTMFTYRRNFSSFMWLFYRQAAAASYVIQL